MDSRTIIFLGIANFVGITANLLFFTKDKDITKKRFLKEIFGSVWISSICYFGLSNFLDWSNEFVYCVCSLVSFTNSQIINFVGKDLMEAIGKSIINWVKTLGGKNNNNSENYDEHEPNN